MNAKRQIGRRKFRVRQVFKNKYCGFCAEQKSISEGWISLFGMGSEEQCNMFLNNLEIKLNAEVRV